MRRRSLTRSATTTVAMSSRNEELSLARRVYVLSYVRAVSVCVWH